MTVAEKLAIVLLPALAFGAVLLARGRGIAQLIMDERPGGALLRRLLLVTAPAVPLAGFLLIDRKAAGSFGAALGIVLIVGCDLMIVVGLLAWAVRALNTMEGGRRQAHRTALALAAIVESSDDAIIGRSLDGTILSWNTGAEAIYGYSAGEIVGRPISILAPPLSDDSQPVLERLVGGKRIDGYETVHRRKDRTLIDVALTISPVFDSHGKVAGVSTIARDISASKREREALIASEERYRLMVETSMEGIWLIDEENRTVFANRKMLEILGRELETIVDASIYDIVDKENWPIEGLSAEVPHNGVTEHHEVTFRRPDGGVVHTVLAASAVLNGDGRNTGGLVMVADMTERELAQRARLELAMIVESSNDAIIGTSAGLIRSWNKGAERTFGYRADEAIGRPPSFLSPTGPTNAAELLGRVMQVERVENVEAVWIKKDGTPIDVSIMLSKIPSEDATAVAVVIRDISELKQLEQHRQREGQKLEAIGQLAGGVAHDFNNWLTAIRGYCEVMLPAVEQNASLKVYVEKISGAAEGAASLTRQLLAFGRKQLLDLQVIDLASVVSRIEDVIRSLVGESIELAIRAEPGLARVEADGNQIAQVVVNLAINARDAMPDGGKLTITAANLDQEAERELRLRRFLHGEGPYVALIVTDTGCGMSEEVRLRVFDPFFTTKGAGVGSGLGLSSAYGIVTQSGGQILVESEPGQGSTFTIYLPRKEAPLSTIELPGEAPQETGDFRGSETLLVVEDKDPVREAIAGMLRDQGYSVLEASGGAQALHICERDDPVDLVLTDVVMPGMTGPELAVRLTTVSPDARMLFMSGYAGREILSRGVYDLGAHFLAKPFGKEALARKVRETLDRAA